MQTLKQRFNEIKHGRLLTHERNELIVVMIILLIITQMYFSGQELYDQYVYTHTQKCLEKKIHTAT